MSVPSSNQAEAPKPASAALFSAERAAGTLALLLGVGSHAINEFVATAVLPDIIRDLGGQDRAFWVFSSFEMMAILAGCLTGAVKARFGPRTPFLLATGLLASGSALAGLSPSLEGLIAGRTLQGFGEGMIIALCYALIPDLFPSNVAPRVFALLAGVWALAAGIGPVSAGALTELWSWRAAFLINIPLTVLLFLLINSALPGRPQSRPVPAVGQAQGPSTRLSPRLILRLALLALSVFLLTVIGEIHAPLPLAATVLGGVVTAGVLLKIDAASRRRLFPSQGFRPHTLIGLGTWIVLFLSVSTAVRAVFVTTFGQVYWGLSVTQASLVTAALSVSWSVFALLASRAPSKAREHLYLALGPFVIVSGLTTTALAVQASSLPLFVFAAVITGAGHGLCNQILLRSLMYSADGEEQTLVSSILPAIASAGVAIGGGITGLIAVFTGLIPAENASLVTREAIAVSGASVFFIGAALTLVPAAATLVLRCWLIRAET
ncbi:MFS transporter [Roseibium aggregatum]|uniref:MFS transporter n=1 Tax=Roseibium aggregatum TaxID=187304 RepID=A0A939EIW5_9HYPH|nr:MFS transporter [Roseibium aggregatum]MBN9673521.1 MFS transporter [Roseibium aggregatum]